MIPHAIELETLSRGLKSDTGDGLHSSEIERLKREYGPNKLTETRKRTLVQRFFDQFKDAMILVLLVAAAVSFGIALMEGESSEYIEPILILVIVVLNAIMGMVQESRAEKALEALKHMSAPHSRVIRDGKESVIASEDLVPGDIVLFDAGTMIPADARLVEARSLKVDESPLTGESVPVEKDAGFTASEESPLGDRLNMVYSGCTVVYGRGKAMVAATGMQTEMGRIAGLLEETRETKTPLQEKLASLGKLLAVIAIAACVVIFIVGFSAGIPLRDIFMIAVSLAVSAIPEGLPAIVTIVLSLGVQRMAKKNAIIRRLPAVETLGSASVICSDKTGTLTQNRMTLVSAYADGAEALEIIGDANSESVRTLLRYGTLCSDGTVEVKDGVETVIGDPTETAIVSAALRNGMAKDGLEKAFPRITEIPFDSDRKLMTTVNRVNGGLLVIVKGAFDAIALRCVSGDIEQARRINDMMADKALRVLAIACKPIDSVPENPTSEDLEQGLGFLGLVGMIDPPRKEAQDAVALCKSAGIRPVMITGDHLITASAIARDLGILNEGDEAITGADLDRMEDWELDNRVEQISVYARVSPQNKIRIVRAWQRKNMVVSMTGDGVNDAPALKSADIGCAMGITGTDVAKGAADMTLSDDNFATIVEAVREGRTMYDNIRKAVGFLLGTNIGELLTVFVSMLVWHQSPLLSMQLLWINLVTDSFPAIALGMEPADAGVMSRPPRSKGESLFAHGLGARVVLQGCLFALLTLIGFRYGQRAAGSIEGGRTMAFLVLSFTQIIHSYNMRSDRSLFSIGVFSNAALTKATAASSALVALVAFVPPVAKAFGLVMLPVGSYFLSLGLSLVPVAVLEIAKAFRLVRSHA